MRTNLRLTPGKPITIAFLVSASLVGCTASGGTDLVATGPSPHGTPQFDGPYAAEFADFYTKAQSDFARKVLEDGEISDSEYAEMTEQFRQCLEGEGITFSGFSPDGAYTTGHAPNGGDTYEIVSTCEEKSGAASIAPLHDIMAFNPENREPAALMAECLARKGVVPEGYAADDYQVDAESRFKESSTLSIDLKQALMDCSTNPLAPDGE